MRPGPSQIPLCEGLVHGHGALVLGKGVVVETSALEEVVVSVDELEAMRLVDVDGLYYEQAAKQMSVSRRTFGRIIDSARKKVAQALIQGMALRIEGGVIEMAEQRTFRCADKTS